jgi:arylsulfatase A-like enzyme
VILISLDTLRADHCGLYGYEKPTTPFLEELAQRGVAFDNHMVSANNTLMSHATMMTGLLPLTHDAYDRGEGNQERLAPPFRTAAELFREAGYATGSFATNKSWLGREYGVMQGFDEVEADWVDNIACWSRYLEWFDSERPERSFTFLHFFDPHSESDDLDATYPYDSDPELIARFAPPQPEDFTGCLRDQPDHCTSRYLNGINAGLETLPPEHLEVLMGLYDAGIRKMDDDLRLLFAALEERGVLERSLIVITSDHGEEFMEQGRLLHGGFTDAIMHVPLLFVYPEGWIEPHRVEAVTRSIDIAPTILDLQGLMPIGQGQSLLSTILEGAPVADTEAFFGPAVLRDRDEKGLFKISANPKDPMFYDLEADPHEQRNLALEEGFMETERYLKAAERVAEVRKLSTRTRISFKKDQSFPPQFGADTKDDAAARRMAEELRKFGYVEVEEDED